MLLVTDPMLGMHAAQFWPWWFWPSILQAIEDTPSLRSSSDWEGTRLKVSGTAGQLYRERNLLRPHLWTRNYTAATTRPCLLGCPGRKDGYCSGFGRCTLQQLPGASYKVYLIGTCTTVTRFAVAQWYLLASCFKLRASHILRGRGAGRGTFPLLQD